NPSSSQRLTNSEQVALAVPEPGAQLAFSPLARIVSNNLGYSVRRLEPRQIVLLECQAPRPQGLYGRPQVRHLDPHLRVIAGRRSSGCEQREMAAAAAVQKSSRTLLDRLETQLLRVEGPRAVQVLGWEAGCDAGVFERFGNGSHDFNLRSNPTLQMRCGRQTSSVLLSGGVRFCRQEACVPTMRRWVIHQTTHVATGTTMSKFHNGVQISASGAVELVGGTKTP